MSANSNESRQGEAARSITRDRPMTPTRTPRVRTVTPVTWKPLPPLPQRTSARDAEVGQKGYDDNTKSADFERKPLVKCLDQTTTETDDSGSSSGTRAPIAIRKEEIAKIAKWKERAEQTTMRSAKVLHRARLRERLYLEETMRGSIPECMLFVGILACYASVLFIRVNPAVMLHTVRTPGRASCRCCPPRLCRRFL